MIELLEHPEEKHAINPLLVVPTIDVFYTSKIQGVQDHVFLF
jgi:hypothetical protein